MTIIGSENVTLVEVAVSFNVFVRGSSINNVGLLGNNLALSTRHPLAQSVLVALVATVGLGTFVEFGAWVPVGAEPEAARVVALNLVDLDERLEVFVELVVDGGSIVELVLGDDGSSGADWLDGLNKVVEGAVDVAGAERLKLGLAHGLGLEFLEDALQVRLAESDCFAEGGKQRVARVFGDRRAGDKERGRLGAGFDIGAADGLGAILPAWKRDRVKWVKKGERRENSVSIGSSA